MRIAIGCVLALALVTAPRWLSKPRRTPASTGSPSSMSMPGTRRTSGCSPPSRYADHAMRSDNNPMNVQMVAGRQAFQDYYTKGFSGDAKGTTLSVTPGRTQTIAPDVRVQEGTWQVTGGPQGSQRGRYLNTYVRQGGEWKIASVATFPEMPPAK